MVKAGEQHYQQSEIQGRSVRHDGADGRGIHIYDDGGAA